MAVFGLASVVLYVVPAIVFLVPAALVSAELASGWKGGVYNWVSEGISPAMGFAAVWCQFAQTTFYYPAVLAYVASTLSYVFAPGLAHSGVYTTGVIIVLFWTSVLVAARGVIATDKFASWGILIGTLIPGLLLVVLAGIYFRADVPRGNQSAPTPPRASARLSSAGADDDVRRRCARVPRGVHCRPLAAEPAWAREHARVRVGTAGRRAPDWRPPASTALPAAQTRVEGRLDRPR